MNARLTQVQRDALRFARAAVESQESAYGQADAIVFALSAAGLLAGPEVGAAAIQLRTDGTLTPGAYARMRAALGVLHATRRQHGDGMVPLVRGLEAAGVLQGPGNAAELVDYRANIRELQNVLAANARKINELEVDRNTDLPRLRESVAGWADRCRAAESDREQLRIRNAELEARAAASPSSLWFLADYEGAEGGPTLHATEEAAKAWVAEWAGADGPWDWIVPSAEPDAGWEQWRTDPDNDRPVSRGSGTVLPLTVELAATQAGPAFPWAQWFHPTDQAAFLDELGAASIANADTDHALEMVEERIAHWRKVALGVAAAEEPTVPDLTVYRASHESIVVGRYTNPKAARDHCEMLVRREWPDGTNLTFAWTPDDPDLLSTEELSVFAGQNDESTTGYVVTPLTIASEYDPDGDE